MRIDIGKSEKVGYWITCLPEALGWYYTMVYTGHSLTRKPDGWLLIVRATCSQQKKVCFYHAERVWDCFWKLGSDMTRDKVKWRDDLY